MGGERELPSAGLEAEGLRVLILSANNERLNMPVLPLGAAMVTASVNEAGHEATLVDLMDHGDVTATVRRAIETVRPGVVGLSVRNIDDQNRDSPRFLLEDVVNVVEACRSSTASPVVVGGAGFSIFPTAALEYLRADFGVWGEGEGAFPLLLNRLESGEDVAPVPGVVAAGDDDPIPPERITDLETLPAPDPAYLEALDFDDPDLWLPVQSRRGCSVGCSYCSTPRIEGVSLRLRPVEAVVDEVRRAVAAGARRFQWVDNTFNRPRWYALELCRALQALAEPIQWRCILYPGGVDRELTEALKSAGCVQASIGFESGAEAVLNGMNKGFGPGDIRQACAAVADAGIAGDGFLMFGAPEETRETVLESLDLVDSLPLAGLKITVGIRVYPGTPLARRAVREGVVSPNDTLLTPTFYLDHELGEWIQRELQRRGLAAK